ncbi:SDR family oxidoreductase [Coralloluteibacterium thermophilus]|uniref:SDR family oxidoreductase n=1 Tax=Coralloluteibacterium thermophilum TaxID=2707049 RepID=A0ABV9NL29_9GAMM
MRVLVAGAYGLIGTYVTARLLADGHAVRGLGRDVAMARRRQPEVEWVAADFGRLEVAQWAPMLRGVDAVVNCVGALQDGPRDDLRAVHDEGVRRLLTACEAAGVGRIVHISAVGVEPGTTEAFVATKADAEAALAVSSLHWTILRPGLVIAPAAYGGTGLLRGLAGLPGVVPVVHGDSTVQVVSVEDVAAAVALALEPGAPPGRRLDLVHAQAWPLAELLPALRAWLGLPPARHVRVPPRLARVAARLSDGLAWLGWRSAMRSAALAQLRRGVGGDAGHAASLGLQPASLGQMLAHWPAGIQERWFARAYFVKPLLLATLALFWILSGLIALGRGSDAVAVLAPSAFPAALAPLAVAAGAWVDITLGAAVCLRRTARAALLGMLAVTAVYLVGATLLRPDLWLDPLGPLLKTIPAGCAAVAALALLEER